MSDTAIIAAALGAIAGCIGMIGYVLGYRAGHLRGFIMGKIVRPDDRPIQLKTGDSSYSWDEWQALGIGRPVPPKDRP